MNRSPSAWLQEGSNRISTRVSSLVDRDIPTDSNNQVPFNKWCLLAFVFENNSNTQHIPPVSSNASAIENKDKSPYNIRLYMNGHLDSETSYTDVILGNENPMHFFQDITFSGAKSLVQDFTIWDGVLSDYQVLSLYLEGKTSFAGPRHANVLQLIDNYTTAILDFFPYDEVCFLYDLLGLFFI